MDMHGELAMPIKHYTSFLQIKFDEVGYYMLYVFHWLDKMKLLPSFKIALHVNPSYLLVMC